MIILLIITKVLEMAIRSLSISSSSTLSIISLGADSSPAQQVSETDFSPITKPHFHNESMVTLFNLNLYKRKDSHETKEHKDIDIINNRCSCLIS